MIALEDCPKENLRAQVTQQRKRFHFGYALFFFIFLLGVFSIRFIFLSEEVHSAGLRFSLLWSTVIFIALFILTLTLLVVTIKANPGFIFSATDSQTSYRCPLCNILVEEFDHHCGLMGVCIGKGNMKYFVLFLISAFLVSFVGAFVGVYYLYRLGVGLNAAAEWTCGTSSSGTAARPCVLLDYCKAYGHVVWCHVVCDMERFAGVLSAIGVLYTTFVCLGLSAIYVQKIVSGTYSLQRRRREMRNAWRHIFRNFFDPDFHLRRDAFDNFL